MQQAVLVIDVGSSSVRAVLFAGADMLDTADEKISAGREIDADAYWQIISQLVSSLTGRNCNVAVTGIGVTSLVSWTFIDAEGCPVGLTKTWMDANQDLLGAFHAAFDQDVFFNSTGRCAGAELGGLKLQRLRHDFPEAYTRVSSLLSFKDFVNFRLTGVAAMDRTTACYTMLYNIRTGAWDADIAAAINVDTAKLPPLKNGNEPVGPLKTDVAQSLGLSPGIPVVACGPDGSVGALGAGLSAQGEAVSVMGTTDVFFAVSEKALLDPKKRLVTNPFLIPGLWLLGGPLGMSGGALDWFAKTIDAGRHSMNELDLAAAAVSPGCDGVMAIPSLTGERTPFWNALVRGTFTGITPETTQSHLYRALMEANGYTTRYLLDILSEMGLTVRSLTAIGGGAKSEFWMQMKADITNCPVHVPAQTEASSLGAAMLAAMQTAGKAAPGAMARAGKTRPGACAFAPSPNERYQLYYQRYLALQKAGAALYEAWNGQRPESGEKP